MNDLKADFKALDYVANTLIGYAYVRCRMIFDVKMEDFLQKERLVAGGHMTATITYARVLSRETFLLALFIFALNDLEVKCQVVFNAFLTAPIEEKVCTTLGPEFGYGAGKRALMFCALYSLKSAGAGFLFPLSPLHASTWM